MTIQACVFDAYGTLFDVAAAARQAAQEPGAESWSAYWPALAEHWRRKQLEYTWLRSVAGAHADFEQVTADALDWALEAEGLADTALRTRLLTLYRTLPAHADARAALAALQAAGLPCAVLSNGSPGMLAAAVASAGIGDLLDAVISVEEVGVFKPHPSVYGLVGARLGYAPGNVLFVSANGWDACSAGAYGFVAVWANRTGAPLDRLHGCPAHVVRDLSLLPDIAARGAAGS